MKVLHLSFHFGCISDMDTVFRSLGHEISHINCQKKLPYHITEAAAHVFWNDNKEFFNSFDLILTTDTVALSFPFLLHLEELTPHLIILNCNRFDYAMTTEPRFKELLKNIRTKLHKLTYIPYTDFERIWCSRHGIYLHEKAIQPIGGYLQHINDSSFVQENFKGLTTQHMTKEKQETVFLQRYHNSYRFMDVSQYLYDRGVSVTLGGYVNVGELKDYLSVVVLPDAFSKYFVFESIQSEIVVLVPTPRLLLELVGKGGYFFNIEGSSGRLQEEFVS